MTQAEQVSLDALRTEVQSGFREMRDLMEKRREEEVRVKEALDSRLRTVERIGYAAGVLGTTGLASAIALFTHYIN